MIVFHSKVAVALPRSQSVYPAGFSPWYSNSYCERLRAQEQGETTLLQHWYSITLVNHYSLVNVLIGGKLQSMFWNVGWSQALVLYKQFYHECHSFLLSFFKIRVQWELFQLFILELGSESFSSFHHWS